MHDVACALCSGTCTLIPVLMGTVSVLSVTDRVCPPEGMQGMN